MRASTGIVLLTALVSAATCYALTYIACGLLYAFWLNLMGDVSLSFASLGAALIPIIFVWVIAALASSAVKPREGA